MKRRFIILAGGSGLRLWPLSTADRPKQLIPFLNNSSLLEQTIDRLQHLKVKPEEIVIVTHKDKTSSIFDRVHDRVGTIVSEPCAKNTAPAILYTLLSMPKVPSDAVITIMPADHFIPDGSLFSEQLELARAHAAQHKEFVLLGIPPRGPDTGYGYISVIKSDRQFLSVARFHEKPDLATAQRYYEQKTTYWNSGLCVASLQTLWDAFKLHEPLLVDMMATVGTDAERYAALPARSFDHAVLEKSINTVLLPFRGDWHDVGTLETFVNLENRYGNKSELIEVEAAHNMVRSRKKAVFFGVDNLCVVETDEALLITSKEKTQRLKVIHEYLKSAA
jgi:mannose-1-phosphate guanylyltransferase